jgi:proton-dependent oligopeptide transporter, POT family
MLHPRVVKAYRAHRLPISGDVIIQSIAETVKMPTNIDDAAIGAKHDPSLALPPDEKHQGDPSAYATGLPLVYEGAPTELPHRQHGRDATNYYDNDAGEWPTEEELHTLRRVADRIPWKAFALAFVEMCERFSYYGTTVVCKSTVTVALEIVH